MKILYEDNHLLVVEKPVNVPSQKDDSEDPDILTMVKEDIKRRYNKPGNVYLGLVHRLDRPVGGVMVLAKTSKAAARLSEQIRSRKLKKVYLAVVHGEMDAVSGHLEHFLKKDASTNTVMVVSAWTEGAKEALLDYTVVGVENNLSLLRVRLHTGRPHQIRVQLSAIGHPLFGDQKYGARLNKPGQQLALWSNQITCIHPTRQEEMTFASIPPGAYPWNLFRL
ncbi:MAG: RluA family pseudouridine synthase [Clostridiales bacterium]|jgi:23S rRNA pseudouridine1911/1915/1917 synthase|nr:RluA family pseudouridine synthase [Eubacteriales bacterium]MDH7567179.1 RluA family pseudouridine synthase [Clostridiales bacterium]